MTAYKKQGGVWNPAARIFVHQSGAFIPSDQVYVKHNGVWTLTHEYDVTPPPMPDMQWEVVEDTYWDSGQKREGRYIRIGVNLPTGHDPGLRRIRVLTTYNGKMPTTPFGGNYNATPAASFPNEPWSDWSYNGFNGYHRDSSVPSFKRFPRTEAGYLGAGDHYFAAWAEDNFGNWSAGRFVTVNIPRRVNVVGGGSNVKEQRFQVTATGIWKQGAFTYGRPTQAKGPIRRGVLFYGGAIKDQIGKSGKASIRKAQIRLERRPDDGGRGRANVYLAHHNFGTVAGFREDASWSKPVKLGQIGKGEAKWFDIPPSWYNAMEKDGMKGFILNHKDPDKSDAQANDFSVMNARGDSLRTGELHVVWKED